MAHGIEAVSLAMARLGRVPGCAWACLLIGLTTACGSGAVPSTSSSGPHGAAATGSIPADPTPTTPAASCPAPGGVASPAARGYHAIVDVPGSGVLMVSGSPNPESGFFADTWAFSPDDGWSAVAACPNVDVTDHASYDAHADRVFAGVGATWLHEPGSARWERLEIAGPPFEPGSRSAYHAGSGRVLLQVANGTTWFLDISGRAWSQSTSEGPPPRGWGALANDTGADRVVLFGGGTTGGDHLGDTWAYVVDDDEWIELDLETRPRPRTYGAMTYVPTLGGVLLFGGAHGPWESETVLDDTWLLDVTSGTWAELETDTAPSARAWHAMAWDAESGLVVLFGGGPDRRRYTDETWLFDPASSHWSEWPAG